MASVPPTEWKKGHLFGGFPCARHSVGDIISQLILTTILWDSFGKTASWHLPVFYCQSPGFLSWQQNTQLKTNKQSNIIQYNTYTHQNSNSSSDTFFFFSSKGWLCDPGLSIEIISRKSKGEGVCLFVFVFGFWWGFFASKKTKMEPQKANVRPPPIPENGHCLEVDPQFCALRVDVTHKDGEAWRSKEACFLETSLSSTII